MNNLIVLSGVLIAVIFVTSLGLYKATCRKQWVKFSVCFICGTLTSALLVLGFSFYEMTQEFTPLVREDKVMTIATDWLSSDHYLATLSYPNGRTEHFKLEGDQVEISAHIIKWPYWLNRLGVHTGYKLDRIRGRYQNPWVARDSVGRAFTLDNSQSSAQDTTIANWPWRQWFVDAQYGSATYVAVRNDQHYEVYLTTTGLMARAVSVNP